jgi:DNA-binding NarL/FixJ family response regulator
MLKVLIVDDAPLVRERVAGALRDFVQVAVLAEYDAAQPAIEGLRQHEPDLVVLDVELKASNGMQVLKHIVDNQLASKVFVFSNHSGLQQRSRFLLAGADGFYSKVGEFDHMLDAIEVLARAA